MFRPPATALGVETWVFGIAGLGLFLFAVGVYHWNNPHRFGGRRTRRLYSSEEEMSGFWRLLVKTASAVEMLLGAGMLLVSAGALLA